MVGDQSHIENHRSGSRVWLRGEGVGTSSTESSWWREGVGAALNPQGKSRVCVFGSRSQRCTTQNSSCEATSVSVARVAR